MKAVKPIKPKAGEMAMGKPAPRMITKALRKAGMPPVKKPKMKKGY